MNNTQNQIIRQSQLKFVADYFKMCDICPSLTDIMSITTMMEKYVLEGYSPDIKASFERIDKFIDDEYRGR